MLSFILFSKKPNVNESKIRRNPMARQKKSSLMYHTLVDNQCPIFSILAATAVMEGIFELVRQKKISDDDLTPAGRLGICVGIALFGLAVLLLFLYSQFRQMRSYGYELELDPLLVNSHSAKKLKTAAVTQALTGTSAENTRVIITTQAAFTLAQLGTPKNEQVTGLAQWEADQILSTGSTAGTSPRIKRRSAIEQPAASTPSNAAGSNSNRPTGLGGPFSHFTPYDKSTSTPGTARTTPSP